MPDHEMCVKHDGEIREIQIQLTEITGDVKHIKDRIDNGMSLTITKIWEKLNIMSEDRIKFNTMLATNSSFIDKVKSAFIWVSFVSIAGGVIGLSLKLIHTYISNNVI